MRNLLINFGFFLPAAIFAIYVIMVAVGCAANCFGAGAFFYCSVFCKAGMGLMALTVIFLTYLTIKKFKS